jgi:hypothetical protein
MIVDIARLLIGLVVVMFHRPIAEYILVQEEALVVLFRTRGVRVPSVPRPGTVQNVYFGIGMFVCLFSLIRIWMTLHP